MSGYVTGIDIDRLTKGLPAYYVRWDNYIKHFDLKLSRDAWVYKNLENNLITITQ